MLLLIHRLVEIVLIVVPRTILTITKSLLKTLLPLFKYILNRSLAHP